MTEPANPFIKYRRHLDVYQFAMNQGMSDQSYTELVSDLDHKVAEVWGTGFVVTPLVDLALGAALPAKVVAKVETGNVSGSHKARHLFGLMIHDLVLSSVGGTGTVSHRDLAIASCGNAALGAAVVASAASRRLVVFVPDDANPLVVDKLEGLGAVVEECRREPAVVGDPCVRRLQNAVRAGAQAFSVQGPLCPESIDGGRTLGLEIADQLDNRGIWVDHAWIQIGGGALASSVMDGLARARPGRRLPRLHPVQAEQAHPYIAGWRRIAPKLFDLETGIVDETSSSQQQRQSADRLQQAMQDQDVVEVLGEWDDLMVPWPHAPTSLASGILDDLTYDWKTVMAHQIRTGGWPVTASEEDFEQAVRITAKQVSPEPDATGTSGLAGIIALGSDAADMANESHLVLITGVERSKVGSWG